MSDVAAGADPGCGRLPSALYQNGRGAEIRRGQPVADASDFRVAE
jgi:hypothetical protein